MKRCEYCTYSLNPCLIHCRMNSFALETFGIGLIIGGIILTIILLS